MKVGILGVGNIGATLTQRLSAAGHDVKVANSRGPETIPSEVTVAGGRAVHGRDVVSDVEALIVSIPLARIPDIRPLVDHLPDGAVVLDTSNYYPFRDGRIAALDEGQVESLWVADQLGRPVVKAWNAILSGLFATKHAPAGTPGRIAIPVAADAEADRALGMALVEETGFDGYDAGSLADSWRQQPGTPAYCTELDSDELRRALAAADKAAAPRTRDRLMEHFASLERFPSLDEVVAINRAAHP
jgi:8-hydroxy-5-deazaflavin:NADPH oxidoreductase